MQRTIFIILIFTISCLGLRAQSNFMLHLDKSFYVTGENIWYKVYLPSELERSIAIKGIVAGPNGKVKERFFIRSNPEQPYIDGVFSIPFSYQSGMYRLAFLASAAPDQPYVELVSIDLPIYNDFEIKSLSEQLQQQQAPPANLAGSAPELQGLQVSITLPKESFSTREVVKAEIKVSDAAGKPVNASLSVVARDMDMVTQAMPDAPTYATGAELEATQLQQLSEKIFVKGQVMDTLGNPIQANVLGGYASLQKRIFYGKTNPEGRFTFPLPDFYGEQTLQFIGYEKEQEEIKVELLEELVPGERPQGALPINEKVLKYLEATQQKKKMAEHFDYLNKNIEIPRVENDFASLKADFSYVAEDYIKFETVGDFFSELLTPLKFRIVNGKYKARMENPRAGYFEDIDLPGKPLFIIDGKLTRNADFIARSSWSNVRSVDIFYVADKLRKQFNILAQGGIVRIETRIPQFNLPANEQEDVFLIKGLVPGSTFVPFRPGGSSTETRLPNFLMPTFWAPDIRTDDSGAAAVEFFQGDDSSTFILEVVAQGPDGKKGKTTVQYTVQ